MPNLMTFTRPYLQASPDELPLRSWRLFIVDGPSCKSKAAA